MDVSVIAAVGSFFMSERVLKPKATVLMILGCILAYDLTTKTHDVASLRVYRGPALLAFTLIMSAYSLRTWRRNGVACDELLFLPGTPHGQNHGIDVQPGQQTSDSDNPVPVQQVNLAESDIAAGVAPIQEYPDEHLETEPGLKNRKQGSFAEQRSTSNARSSRSASYRTASNGCISNQSDDNNGDVEMASLMPRKSTLESNDTDFATSWDSDIEDSDVDAEAASLIPANANSRSNSLEASNEDADGSHNNPARRNPLDLHQFQEDHPRITRIGSFFFFRSSSSSTQNAAYAPSGPAVVGAALDLSMPILFNFHLFIEAFNHIQPQTPGSETPAKILPIIFLSVLMFRSFFPPGRRGRFWNTMRFTAMAPFHRVRFRDAYIGDILTSLVRPGQDVLFALSYYFTVVWGSITGKYGLTESGVILEQSWLLHNVVLPSCALLPLWWKFLQTLRQAYDEQKRWPHLGNACKYLSATLVVLYGMTHPQNRRSPWWIVSFICCLLYQLWWDMVMDWELFELPSPQPHTLESADNCFANISSLRPNSHFLLALQMHVFTPLADNWRRLSARIANLKNIELRSRRLYKSRAFYWRIVAYNVVMRFTWMLCFIPAYRLTANGNEKMTTFSSDVHSYVGVLLPVAEIIRRTFWGFLFLEKETLKMTEGAASYARIDSNDLCEDDEEDYNDSEEDHSQGGKDYQIYLPLWLNAQQQIQHSDGLSGNHLKNDLFHLSDDDLHNLYVAELSLWALAFIALGCWAAS